MPSLKDAQKKPGNIGALIPPAAPSAQNVPPIIPREQPGLSPTSLGPAPSVWTTGYDSVRQWARPGTSQSRFPSLPTKANPQLNAAARSVATSVVNSLVTPTKDDDTISVDQVTSSPYTLTTGDYRHLKVLIASGGGTVILPGSIALLDVAATNSGDSSAAAISATPTQSTDWALYSQTTQGNNAVGVDGSGFADGTGATAAVSATAARTNDYAVFVEALSNSGGGSTNLPAGFTQIGAIGGLGTMQLSASGTVNASASIGGSGNWAAGLILLPTQTGGSVAIRQEYANASGALDSGTTTTVGTSGSALQAGNTLLVIVQCFSSPSNTHGSFSIGGISDSAGNEYFQIFNGGIPDTTPPPPTGCIAAAFICPRVKAGSPTITLTTGGPVSPSQVFASGQVFAFELTGVGNFGPQGNWTDITPGGQQPGYGDFGQLLTTTSMVNVSSPFNVTQYWNNALALFETTNNVVPSVTQSTLITGSSTTTFSGILSSNTVKGDTMIVSIHYDAASQPTFTVTDTQGNVYNLVGSVYQSTPTQGTAVYAATVLTSGSNTVNITSSVNATADISVIEMNGLGAPSNAGFPKGFWCELENIGSGAWTVQSQSTIDGGGSIKLPQNNGVFLHYDGFNWFTERGLSSAGPQNTPAVSHEWLASYNSTTNQFTQAQPAFSDISGTASLVQGGTGANLSATGGAGQVVQQTSVGAPFTVGQLNISQLQGTVVLDDDFVNANGSNPFQSAITWSVASGSVSYSNWLPPADGVITYNVNSSSNSFVFIVPNGQAAPGSNSSSNYWILFDNPKWTYTTQFILNVGNGISESNTSPTAFSMAKTSMYLGLGNMPHIGQYNATPRLPFFCGLRYDTDPGNSYTLSAAGNASGGNTVYTGTFSSPSGNGNNLKGYTFTISGFTNAGNNGTFVCVASTTTSVTLANSGGVSESHAATATQAGIGDSAFQFECVSNSAATNTTTRCNTQGNVQNTSMTPTEGVLYTFTMQCTTTGQVAMTLSGGGSSFSQTMTMPQFNWTTGLLYRTGGGQGYVEPEDQFTLLVPTLPIAVGHSITVANTGQATVDGIRTVIFQNSSQIFNFLTTGTISETTASTGSITCYPAMAPFVAYGNDTSASPTAGRSQFGWDSILFTRG